MGIRITVKDSEIRNPLIRLLVFLIGLLVFILILALVLVFFLAVPLFWFFILAMASILGTILVALPGLARSYRFYRVEKKTLEHKNEIRARGARDR